MSTTTLTPEQQAAVKANQASANKQVASVEATFGADSVKKLKPFIFSVAYTAASQNKVFSTKALTELTGSALKKDDPSKFLKDFAGFYKREEVRTPLVKLDTIVAKFEAFEAAKAEKAAQNKAAEERNRAERAARRAELDAAAKERAEQQGARDAKLSPEQLAQKQKAQRIAGPVVEAVKRVAGKANPADVAEVTKYAYTLKDEELSADALEAAFRSGATKPKVKEKKPAAPELSL